MRSAFLSFVCLFATFSLAQSLGIEYEFIFTKSGEELLQIESTLGRKIYYSYLEDAQASDEEQAQGEGILKIDEVEFSDFYGEDLPFLLYLYSQDSGRLETFSLLEEKVERKLEVSGSLGVDQNVLSVPKGLNTTSEAPKVLNQTLFKGKLNLDKGKVKTQLTTAIGVGSVWWEGCCQFPSIVGQAKLEHEFETNKKHLKWAIIPFDLRINTDNGQLSMFYNNKRQTYFYGGEADFLGGKLIYQPEKDLKLYLGFSPLKFQTLSLNRFLQEGIRETEDAKKQNDIYYTPEIQVGFLKSFPKGVQLEGNVSYGVHPKSVFKNIEAFNQREGEASGFSMIDGSFQYVLYNQGQVVDFNHYADYPGILWDYDLLSDNHPGGNFSDHASGGDIEILLVPENLTWAGPLGEEMSSEMIQELGLNDPSTWSQISPEFAQAFEEGVVGVMNLDDVALNDNGEYSGILTSIKENPGKTMPQFIQGNLQASVDLGKNKNIQLGLKAGFKYIYFSKDINIDREAWSQSFSFTSKYDGVVFYRIEDGWMYLAGDVERRKGEDSYNNIESMALSQKAFINKFLPNLGVSLVYQFKPKK